MIAERTLEPRPPILIAGTTASGKSALALALARELGGCVINADSMQVYGELRILTARPDETDEAQVPHLLYGHVCAREAYSAGRYVADAAQALQAALDQGLRPIIVGGTGLYFKALLEGLSPIPPIADDVRMYWRAEGERLGSLALHGILAARDPGMAARLDASDTQRIVRALEVLEQTGQSLAVWQQMPGVPVIGSDALKLLISRPREEVQARAEARFDAMLKAGALEEAARLSAMNLPPELPAMRALGVAPLIATVRGELVLAEAASRAKAETRQYIKRQETWFRRQMISWMPIKTQQMECIASKGFSVIDLER